MNPRKTTITILAALSVSLAVAEDFKTVNGKEYKKATVSRVEPDGIVLKSKSGISKVYFTELPKEVQERFHYNVQTPSPSGEPNTELDSIRKRQKEAIRERQEEVATTEARKNLITAPEPMATSGIDGLPPITTELKEEILNALGMTDRLDGLYKRDCTSAEFIAAATPMEGVFMSLQYKLPKGDPRRDLVANTFEAYQQAALAMTAYERGRGQRPDGLIGAAGVRKGLLMKVLEGNMTVNEKQLYQAWLQGHP
jgi:hypothetical protein